MISVRAFTFFRNIAFAAVALLPLPAVAAPIIFSGWDEFANSADPRPNSNAAAASFDTAAGALGTLNIITFESVPAGSFSSLTVAPGVSIGGIDFYGSDQSVRNSPAATPDFLYGYNTTLGGSVFVYLQGGTLTFTFTNPVSAFGAFLSGIQVGGETINFFDGSTQSLVLPNPGDGGAEFFGFTDAGNLISSITVNATFGGNSSTGGTGDFIGVDDVRFVTGSVSQIPEPLTVSLFLGGLVGVAALRRAKIKQA